MRTQKPKCLMDESESTSAAKALGSNEPGWALGLEANFPLPWPCCPNLQDSSILVSPTIGQLSSRSEPCPEPRARGQPICGVKNPTSHTPPHSHVVCLLWPVSSCLIPPNTLTSSPQTWILLQHKHLFTIPSDNELSMDHLEASLLQS